MTRVRIIDGDRLKSGDTDPNLEVQLRQRNDNPRSLQDHEVRLYLAEVESDEVVISADTDGNLTITDEVNGFVEYSWQQGDTDKVGTYIGEFEVEELDEQGDPTGHVETFPNRGHFNVRIQQSLGDN